tara:strand:- start:89 stop:469 length:381 start_codon:yes stop_codon:yes gene_type:complete
MTMEEIKNTKYDDLNEQQWLTLFVENIKNIRYFTMMQLLSNDQFNKFLKDTNGDEVFPSYNFGYNYFHFLGYRWPGMGQERWEASKPVNETNESNDVAVDDAITPSAPIDTNNIYKRKNTIDIDDY